jgi:hypothetical protein
MTRQRKTPAEIRAEAARAIRYEANCAESMGDPEGAGRLRDLAHEVSRLRLTRDVQP